MYIKFKSLIWQYYKAQVLSALRNSHEIVLSWRFILLKHYLQVGLKCFFLLLNTKEDILKNNG